MKILLFGVSGARSLGYAINQRLLSEGHSVTPLTGSPDEIRSLTKRQLQVYDAVIDPQLSDDSQKGGPPPRPLSLLKLLKGSSKRLIVTSSAAVLGDTGPVPVGEGAKLRAPRKFAWLAELESEIVGTSGLLGVAIRPAIEHYRTLSVAMGNCIALALRFREGKYIGDGTNLWSAVHRDDLADLYCLATCKTETNMLIHGVTETFSMREVAQTIHRGLGLKGEPSTLALEEARKYSPIAENLARSSAMLGDLAKQSLGWKPYRASLLKQIEHEARASRSELGRVSDGCFKSKT